jgi:hypothetical protein
MYGGTPTPAGTLVKVAGRLLMPIASPLELKSLTLLHSTIQSVIYLNTLTSTHATSQRQLAGKLSSDINQKVTLASSILGNDFSLCRTANARCWTVAEH